MTNYRRKPRGFNQAIPSNFVINQNIHHPQVRVISGDGDMIGILPLKQALDMAFDKDMDLIEINPKGEPPVCKMMDFAKYKYQLSKAEALKPPTADKEKTLRLSVRIASNDLLMNARKADDFLIKKNKVKIQIKMRGREKSHPELTKEVMTQFLEMVTEAYDFVSEPKLVGDSNMCTIKLGKK